MYSKWKSRKFWLAIIGTVFSVIATLGFDIPVDQVLVSNALIAVWILVEGVNDAVRTNKGG